MSFLRFDKRSFVPIEGLSFATSQATLSAEVWFRTSYEGGAPRHALAAGTGCTSLGRRSQCCAATDGRENFLGDKCVFVKHPSLGDKCDVRKAAEYRGWGAHIQTCATFTDNWSLLDFDRSEQFGFFVRADDGRLEAGGGHWNSRTDHLAQLSRC